MSVQPTLYFSALSLPKCGGFSLQKNRTFIRKEQLVQSCHTFQSSTIISSSHHSYYFFSSQKIHETIITSVFRLYQGVHIKNKSHKTIESIDCFFSKMGHSSVIAKRKLH